MFHKNFPFLSIVGVLAIIASFTLTPTIGNENNYILYHSVDISVFLIGLGLIVYVLYKLLHHKGRLRALIVQFIIALFLSIIFAIIIMPFLLIAEFVPYDKKADIGQINMWRIVIIYGLLTIFTLLATILKKKLRVTGAILGLFWVLGTAIVTIVSVLPMPITSQSQAATEYKTDCGRNTPYDMPEEFRRALSLLGQRQRQAGGGYNDDWVKFYHCINIQYADLSAMKAEGVFKFDINSPRSQYNIYVDRNYQSYDDLLTAILLAHETTHARQLEDYRLYGIKPDCYQAEHDAFKQEMIFALLVLNDEEQKSILTRVVNEPTANSAYSSIATLTEISNKAANYCASKFPIQSEEGSEYNKCYWEIADRDLNAMVRESTAYQEQCRNFQ